jgi:TPP-dependent 2-oxoacid decarboxylase
MSATVGDFLVERLHEWGVRHIFVLAIVTKQLLPF